MGAYSGYPPPATIPSFQGTAGTWRNDGPLGTRLVLNELSYLDSAAGGTRYRTTGGLDYLVVGDLSGGTDIYRALTPPATFPGWDTNNLYGFGYGTWYNDGPQGLRLVLGDTYAQPTYLTRNIERYTYNLDGYLTQVSKQTQQAIRQFGVETVQGEVSAAQLVSNTSYDAMGRVTGLVQYDATGGFVYERYGIVYDLRNLVLSEKSKTRQGQGFTYTHSVNYYTARGDGAGVSAPLIRSASAVGTSTGSTLYFTETKQWYDNDEDFAPGYGTPKGNGGWDYTKRDTDLADTYTTYAYEYWDGAQQQSISLNNRDGTSVSSFVYDKLGHVAQVSVGGPRAHKVNYTTDAAGQVISRIVTDGPNGQSPKQFYFYFNGIQIGSNGNNGNDNPDLAQEIKDRGTEGPTDPGIFRNGASTPTQYADFDLAYLPVNGSNPGGSSAAHTVQAGETLQSIAQLYWGDASLWYMIAESNGLSSASQISAGQTLAIPNKVANVHNNASTYRPYDGDAALGDIQPGVPKPTVNKNKNCGFLGVILRAIVKAVVKAAVFIVASAVPVIGTILSLPIIGPALTASIVSTASQGINVALGLQDRVEWKAVASAGISAGVNDGLSRIGGPIGKVINGTGIGSIVVKAVVKNAITQGISTAVGLQKKFSWTNVAVAGVTAATEKLVSDAIGAPDTEIENFFKNLVVGAAGIVAGEAARSLIKGTDFGDNVLAALPDLLEETLADSLTPIASELLYDLGDAIESIGAVPTPEAESTGSANAAKNTAEQDRVAAAKTGAEVQQVTFAPDYDHPELWAPYDPEGDGHEPIGQSGDGGSEGDGSIRPGWSIPSEGNPSVPLSGDGSVPRYLSGQLDVLLAAAEQGEAEFIEARTRMAEDLALNYILRDALVSGDLSAESISAGIGDFSADAMNFEDKGGIMLAFDERGFKYRTQPLLKILGQDPKYGALFRAVHDVNIEAYQAFTQTDGYKHYQSELKKADNMFGGMLAIMTGPWALEGGMQMWAARKSPQILARVGAMLGLTWETNNFLSSVSRPFTGMDKSLLGAAIDGVASRFGIKSEPGETIVNTMGLAALGIGGIQLVRSGWSRFREVGPEVFRPKQEIVVTAQRPQPGNLDFVGPVNFRNADGSVNIDVAARRYSDLVRSNKPWKWKDFGPKFKDREQSAIRAEAIKQGLIPEIPYKSGTDYLDFEAAGLVEAVDTLPQNLWKKGDKAQFLWLDARLPEGRRPEGFTWHHSEVSGRMELVPFGVHNIYKHSGGRSPGHWAAGGR